MLEYLLAAGLGFLLTYVFGKALIPYLRKLKFGQKILEIGPKWHMGKQGTPTMGGIMFILGSGLACIFVGVPQMLEGDFRHIIVFLFALTFGFIGLIDDYAKIKKKKNQGLTAIQKLLLQLISATVFLSILRYIGDLNPVLYVPFFGVSIDVGWIPYLVIMLLAIVGTVNAVNLTDGVDGLATSVTMPVLLVFGLMGAYMGYTTSGLFAAALFGGLAAFLIYNFNPAKVFMGDTGSLFLGGAVCGMAFAYDLPLLLLLMGIVYIVEALSVILQVTYFKLTHGKRLFKMSPIHHHFEMCGWNEKKICIVFMIVSAIGALVGFAGIQSMLI
ncbi:MAG: phospho-N-acetylmuramoyl-pentapeptide-transferase [Oscillospiraceae bacterium]|nr:phospho-N-acetylmuramoyl-pentapeptide-transferase [Oscillospiraceae bacterium]MBQ6845512.1 phospho-N-acetylmuramoyl-pentapeptide-transferase [Oscillospiraceae bacterium]MBQ7119246.1 phospho-N-acetylmuramoyl-pentapeptide-transferase [Oscillospiraceae bacterium]